MSYFRFLGVFVCLPIVLLFLLTRRLVDKTAVAAIAGTSAIAVAYTTPWDNLIVLNKVWTWRRDRVVGITFGVVPLEEYCFFVLQTVLTSLFTLLLVKKR